MDNFSVTFELVNGKTHTYELENTTHSDVYTKVSTEVDGWISIDDNGENHLIKANSVCKVEILSGSEREERSKRAMEAMNAWDV